MQKHFLYAFILLVTLLWGCKKDEAVSIDSTKVTIEIEEIVTRTISEGNRTRFEAGDTVVISSEGLVIDMYDTRHLVTPDMQLAGEEYYYDWDKPAFFYAHYPSSAITDNKIVKMTVGEDQSCAELFNANDFMTASTVGIPKNDGNIRLKFHHRLTLVKLIWSGLAQSSGACLDGVLNESIWEKTTNTLTSDGDRIKIKMWQQGDNSDEYWALIPHQVVPAGIELIKIKDEVQEFVYKTTSDIRFNNGTIKKIVLTQNLNGMIEASFSDVDIENWSDDNVMTDGTVDIKR